jgi:hypothetical protein
MRKYLLFSLILVLAAFPVWAGDQTTSGVTAQTLVDDAQVYLNDAGNDLCTDQQLLQFLNDGMKDLVALSHCYQTTETITLLSGVTQYDLSTHFMTIKGAIYNGGSTTYNKPLEEWDLFDGGEDGKGLGMPEDVGEPVYWDEFAGEIAIWPAPTSSVSGYRVTTYLVAVPSGVTIDQAIPTPAIYDKALTYYITAQAWYRDRQFGFGDYFMGRYEAEIARYRKDLNIGKETE